MLYSRGKFLGYTSTGMGMWYSEIEALCHIARLPDTPQDPRVKCQDGGHDFGGRRTGYKGTYPPLTTWSAPLMSSEASKLDPI